ncbi:MAG TPA: NAD-dependent epimerase/dehydratase family protein, partial [Anaerolineaceae bacterium]|nr:NAD-dependent epimerase/dehydratase family protein [Anaerolineaceae bacterium]
MHILVTGSTGFIGGRLCQALAGAGHTVRAFHRSTSNLRLLEGLEVEHAIGDLTQPETLRAAMENIEVVFHAAALLDDTHAGQLYTITVEGTRAVLEAARQAGVRRVVHTSSVAALGMAETPPGGKVNAPTPLNEMHTWNYRPDRWPYGYAKYLAELEVQRAVAHGLDAVIVNPALVIGAGDVYRQATSPVVQVARGRLSVATTGGLNVVHIDDVTSGHIAAMERGKTGERYLLTGENLTLLEFLRKIAGVAGVRPPGLVFPAWLVRGLSIPASWLQSILNLPFSISEMRDAGRYFYFENRKSQAALKLPPPRSAEDAIRDAYDWFK